VLSEFYNTGIDKNEKMCYFYHTITKEDVMNSLENAGLTKIREYVACGQFHILHYKDVYTLNGAFDPEAMIARVMIMIKGALDEGYNALRVCGDMSWVHNEMDLTSKLIRYEAMLNKEFPNSFSAICLYDVSVFEPVQMLQTLSTHPQAIINEKLYHNIYYMPPEEYLGPDLNEAMLKRWMQNIEERKNVEEQLIASRMEAEKAAYAKSNFLATMSHEIRNPTNGIIGSVDMLAQTQITQDQREFVNIIQSSAKHLYRVVNDVLDFSKTESGKLSLASSPIRVSELLQDSIRLCQYSIQKNLAVSLKYHTHPDCPAIILGDETRLRQILVNLIGNACKFTEEGDVIVYVTPLTEEEAYQAEKDGIEREKEKDKSKSNSIKLNGSSEMKKCKIDDGTNSDCHDSSKKQLKNNFHNIKNKHKEKELVKNNHHNCSATTYLEFSVSDSGAGISTKDQTQLFQKFTQIDVTRKWAGTGLGLAICKQLVEAMGGTILVTSVKGQGSTFYFRIPVGLPPPSPSMPPSPHANIAEDNLNFSLSDKLTLVSPTSPLLLPPDYLPDFSPVATSALPIPLSPSSSPSSRLQRSISSVFLDPPTPSIHALPSSKNILPSSLSSILSSSTSLSSSSSMSSPHLSSSTASTPSPSPSPSLSSLSSPSVLSTPTTGSPPTDHPTFVEQSYDFSDEHILVVEDDITNQKVLQHMLRRVLCKVTVACNGLEAVKLAADNQYTMILTDQYMPELDGFTAVKQIRERYAITQRRCPTVVVCTGTYEARLEEVMDDILIKPVRFKTMLDVLARYCTNKAVHE